MTPDEYTIVETFVEVGDSHTLYVHDWGNKKAVTPIILPHGGERSSYAVRRTILLQLTS